MPFCKGFQEETIEKPWYKVGGTNIRAMLAFLSIKNASACDLLHIGMFGFLQALAFWGASACANYEHNYRILVYCSIILNADNVNRRSPTFALVFREALFSNLQLQCVMSLKRVVPLKQIL